MSIVIRLQNLPITAKSGDIRKFFGGLRIPDGGVHILGGDKGDAFIVFLSDEDGRLAMRKDGGKIRDLRVKLFLSSRMEMQHEIERVTKIKPDDPFFDEEPPKERDTYRKRSTEKKRLAESLSPSKYEDWRIDERRLSKDYPRQMSPVSFDSREFSPKRYRSRSPRRSRSPVVSFPSSRSSSYRSKYRIDRRRKSTSPFSKEFHALPLDIDLSHSLRENSDPSFLFRSERQAELEKRITEELEKNSLLRKTFSDQESISHQYPESFLQSFPSKEEIDDFIFPHSSGSSDLHKFRFRHDSSLDRNKPGYMSPDLLLSDEERRNMNHGFYIALTGLHPSWGFREIQLMLKGHYAPQNNIRFERNEAGFKTGTAFVKLAHGEDFEEIMKKGVCFFNGIRVTVSECPDFIAYNYFLELEQKDHNYIPKNRNLCYNLKGLPFSCSYDDIINFFQGFEISDMIIFYGEDGRATGTGFVSFSNWKDFTGAFSLNGKKIAHRYIEMLPSTDKEMEDAKLSQRGGSFAPYNKILPDRKLPTSRRPLCAILTGLPFFISPKKLVNFFAESGLKPDAIHVTLNKKKSCDGRAFIEISNFLDFDHALKFHGKRIADNVVCVKQILYDEMVNILSSTKARHHFEAPAPEVSAPDEPEKVPYLWVPPDEQEEKEMNVRDEDFNKMSGSMSSSAPPYNANFSSGFPPKAPYKRNFENPYYPQPFPSKVDDILKPGKSNINNQFMTAPPVSEMYSSTSKYEENIKSSRLSPEYEAKLLDFLNKTKMPSKYKGYNRKSKSPERRNRKAYSEKSLDETKKLYKEEKGPKLHDDNEKKCVVQLSNVDVSVGTRDLINFLHGFDFDEKTLIRRYTLEGEPTPDVRVTFSSVHEAKRALKLLNKRILRDKKINIFIV